jgi:hypothetical protein
MQDKDLEGARETAFSKCKGLYNHCEHLEHGNLRGRGIFALSLCSDLLLAHSSVPPADHSTKQLV